MTRARTALLIEAGMTGCTQIADPGVDNAADRFATHNFAITPPLASTSARSGGPSGAAPPSGG